MEENMDVDRSKVQLCSFNCLRSNWNGRAGSRWLHCATRYFRRPYIYWNDAGSRVGAGRPPSIKPNQLLELMMSTLPWEERINLEPDRKLWNPKCNSHIENMAIHERARGMARWFSIRELLINDLDIRSNVYYIKLWQTSIFGWDIWL